MLVDVQGEVMRWSSGRRVVLSVRSNNTKEADSDAAESAPRDGLGRFGTVWLAAGPDPFQPGPANTQVKEGSHDCSGDRGRQACVQLNHAQFFLSCLVLKESIKRARQKDSFSKLEHTRAKCDGRVSNQ